MSDDIKVLGISGSLRSGSYNSAALQEAIGLVPPGMSIELADISGIPLYNEDVYALGFPPAVERFREQIRAADALLFATPEYNYSMAGVLKNAIDWASRPPEQPFSGKPAAILQAPLLKEIFQVRATELFDPADGARILRFGALAQGGISEKPVH